MSKWRGAAANSIYVIPDIHGGISLLKQACDRILPLRKSDGAKDTLVFLGDYIDRHADSHLVLDFLIDLKKKYGDQVVFLMGNHELMALYGLDAFPGKELTMQSKFHNFRLWMGNGGTDTVYGYAKRAGVEDGWGNLTPSRILDIIPKEHIEFLQNLKKFYETDDYIFVHGGMDPYKSPYNQEMDYLTWDRDLLKTVMNKIYKNEAFDWEKTIVTGHNVVMMSSNGKKAYEPIITDKFLMLDCGAPKQLLIVELNSMEAFMAKPDKQRMVKFELKETVKI